MLNGETIFWVVLFILAVFSRFYILGTGVMSHDENSHVYYSWRYYKGEGFQHDPLMHGPLLFHLTAGSFFMFGDNDFTGRLPQALCGVAMIMFMLCYRRYLGRVGAMIAGVLLLISPYMLFTDRYARNEAYIGLFGVVFLWAILRSVESGGVLHLSCHLRQRFALHLQRDLIYIHRSGHDLPGLLFHLSHLSDRLAPERLPLPLLIALIVVLMLVGTGTGPI